MWPNVKQGYRCSFLFHIWILMDKKTIEQSIEAVFQLTYIMSGHSLRKQDKHVTKIRERENVWISTFFHSIQCQSCLGKPASLQQKYIHRYQLYISEENVRCQETRFWYRPYQLLQYNDHDFFFIFLCLAMHYIFFYLW